MATPRIIVLPAGTIVVIVEPVPGIDDYAQQLQEAVEATARNNTPKGE